MDGMVFARQEPKPPDYLIARVKPKQLPDVLRLLVRRAACEASAADAAIALLEHDRKELHVLHSSSSNCGGAAGGSRDAPAGGSSRRSSSSGSGDGLPGWYLTWLSKGSKAARDQQQWRMSDDAAVQLVEELLGVSVTYNLSSLCQALAALPPAQYIGESAAGCVRLMPAVQHAKETEAGAGQQCLLGGQLR
jgi:hypothetical protein